MVKSDFMAEFWRRTERLTALEAQARQIESVPWLALTQLAP